LFNKILPTSGSSYPAFVAFLEENHSSILLPYNFGTVVDIICINYKTMKKIFTLGFAAMAATAMLVAGIKQNETIKWNKTTHDFGTVKMGPPADVTFTFTNNGKAPVVITAAAPSCGCTTPTYTKTPVMPGKTGEVKASYGTEGRPGFFQKSVKVSFDNGASTDLTITGTVSTESPAGNNTFKV
jgi:hypothetical protein